MKRLFQREFTQDEFIIYNKVIKTISENARNLVKELDGIIENYTPRNRFEISFYLDQSGLSDDEKVEYLKELKEKISKMIECWSIRVKVANPIHPMCWCYHLANYFKKKNNDSLFKFFESKIMFGFSVPYYPDKPIMLAHYTLESEHRLHEILAHELTHSLMGTKDYNATTHDKAINDAWTLCFLF